MKKRLTVAIAVFSALAVILAASFAIYVSIYYHADSSAEAGLASDAPGECPDRKIKNSRI